MPRKDYKKAKKITVQCAVCSLELGQQNGLLTGSHEMLSIGRSFGADSKTTGTGNENQITADFELSKFDKNLFD